MKHFGFRQHVPRFIYITVAFFSVFLGLFLWWLLSVFGVLSADFFPDPISVVDAGVVMFGQESFGSHVLASATRIYVAFAVSAVLAIPLGLLMSSFKITEALLEPLVDFIRYVPVPALLPLFVLLVGIGEAPKFLVLFFGTFFQLVLLVMDDADNVPSIYFELPRTMGAKTIELFRDVLFPYLLPQLYDRLRVTLGWCWTYLVIAEVIAVDTGMGRMIKEAQRYQDVDRLFVCLITMGLIGLLTDYAAKYFFRRLFPYASKASLAHG